MTGRQDTEDMLEALPALLRELAAAGVEELEVSAGDATLYVRQRPGAVPLALAPVALSGASANGASGSDAEEEAGLVAISTPLSGMFYPAPAPDELPYVREGDEVEPGQVVGLVEAMKVFNEIRAETAGVVVRILATAGQMVPAGTPLMKVRPAAPGPAAAAS